MKKLSYLATAAVLSLGTVSCSTEDDLAISPGGNVNFSIELPAEMATRAYSDGSTASTLIIMSMTRTEQPPSTSRASATPPAKPTHSTTS